MRLKTRKYLIFIIPIVLILISAVIMTLILLPKEITAQTYYDSLVNSNYTKHEQITTVVDGDNVVYEKVETLVFDGDNIYHKITEKTLSLDINKYFDETINEYYYSKEKMYFKDGDVWNIKDFNIEENLKIYNLKDDYFDNYTFEKNIISEGNFKGALNNDNIDDVFLYESGMINAIVNITIDFDLNIKHLNITAKTDKNLEVMIKNIYTYNKNQVKLPKI